MDVSRWNPYLVIMTKSDFFFRNIKQIVSNEVMWSFFLRKYLKYTNKIFLYKQTNKQKINKKAKEKKCKNPNSKTKKKKYKKKQNKTKIGLIENWVWLIYEKKK